MAILVCALSRVAGVIAARQPSRVVSLLDPDTPFPETQRHGVASHLKVSIHDIEREEAGFTHAERRHIAEILTFLEGWDQAAPLLVHCYAGISRSTATAFIAACMHNPGAEELRIAQALRQASLSASPNRRLVELADAELGRDGRMRRAIEAIGRGQSWLEIGEAEPFEIAARHG